MNVTTKIQIQSGEPAKPLPVPVRFVTATASRLPGGESVDSNHIPGRFIEVAGSSGRSVEVEQFIALVRRVLRKRGRV